MTTEDLMKPRYKVVADYPHSAYSIGDVIEGHKAKALHEYFDAYPHLFKKMEWWEDRKIEDMPKYLKYPNNGIVFEPAMMLPDVGYFYNTDKEYLENDGYLLKDTLPATQAEYEEYLTSLKK